MTCATKSGLLIDQSDSRIFFIVTINNNIEHWKCPCDPKEVICGKASLWCAYKIREQKDVHCQRNKKMVIIYMVSAKQDIKKCALHCFKHSRLKVAMKRFAGTRADIGCCISIFLHKSYMPMKFPSLTSYFWVFVKVEYLFFQETGASSPCQCAWS